MYKDIIIPRDSVLYSSFQKISTEQNVVFFAGLPGVGKSLLLQQFALMAHEAGRVVHLLQWDVTRARFETDKVLARYPEIDGVTHAAIRKAVGLWIRHNVIEWYGARARGKRVVSRWCRRVVKHKSLNQRLW